ncbi:peroxiredoxin-like family protein [Actinophytocola sp.]|jgi:peroxiredoxin|uniref:peroxiredoxin-like family protein n=1 Tax=Actinophytocola sp. TaxID=1872138 RepID=UPI002ED89021
MKNLIPDHPYDLTVELTRLRGLRDEVIPPEVAAHMDQATAALVESKAADRAVGVGTRAPDFTLPNAAGKDISLKRLLNEGAVVVSFYRGIWCPFCNLELRALQQSAAELTRLGARLVAISGQTPDNSLSTAEKNGLTYEVLSDVGLTVARSYGLVFALPEYLQADYRELGHPLSQFNGTDQNTLPIPGTFVIDPAGVVRYAYVNPNYMYRADPAAVIAALRTPA